MSYEGYEQLLCENGHLHMVDCWDSPDPKTWRCDSCGAKLAWWNAVDQTNGSYHTCSETGEEVRIDGFVELEVDREVVSEECPLCGHEKVLEDIRYKTPTHAGHRVKRSQA